MYQTMRISFYSWGNVLMRNAQSTVSWNWIRERLMCCFDLVVHLEARTCQVSLPTAVGFTKTKQGVTLRVHTLKMTPWKNCDGFFPQLTPLSDRAEAEFVSWLDSWFPGEVGEINHSKGVCCHYLAEISEMGPCRQWRLLTAAKYHWPPPAGDKQDRLL